MPHERQRFGTDAESLAAQFLEEKGWTIIARHFTTRFGELDLVADDGKEVVFIEVKARRNLAFGYPEEAVTPQKIRKIALAAQLYLNQHQGLDKSWRVDVIAIEWTETTPRISHFEAVS